MEENSITTSVLLTEVLRLKNSGEGLLFNGGRDSEFRSEP